MAKVGRKSLENPDLEGEWRMAHVDLGVRYNFGAATLREASVVRTDIHIGEDGPTYGFPEG